MRLNRVTLTDFGLFRGTHEIDLVPRANGGHARPIVLFGGKNGAGKSTLLEAVQLCLYGRSAPGTQMARRDYTTYLNNWIHRYSNGKPAPNEAAVAVEFEYASMGQLRTYLIRRAWSRHGSGVQDTLEVSQDGSPLDALDGAHWQDFIRELVPPGLSQLFFFDGERIQRLADDEDDVGLVDSIKALLGLDLVERLDADLGIFRARQVSRPSSETMALLNDAAAAVKALQGEIATLQQRRAEVFTEWESLQCGIRGLEQGLTRLGGRFAADRQTLLSRKADLAARISECERRIRESAEGALPFAFCPQLIARTSQQMRLESEAFKHRAVSERMTQIYDRVQARMQNGTKKSRRSTSITTGPEAAFLALLREEVEAVVHADPVEILHGHSEDARQRILALFDHACGDVTKELRKLTSELEALTRDLQDVEARLKQIPEDDTLRPTMQDLSEKHKSGATLDQGLRGLDEQLDDRRRRLSKAERDVKKCQQSLENDSRHASRLDLLSRCQAALTAYSARLTDAKVAGLQHEITTCFLRLIRKTDVVQSLHIDPRNFTVTLMDRQGGLLHKTDLSAGEKQIYAIAVLWGLARTSGRALPMIIDTPLGRLDSDHRRNLVEHYFPNAAHQVIILSTDTEIDQKYFSALNGRVSHAYHLDFDGKALCTRLNEGYFWKKG